MGVDQREYVGRLAPSPTGLLHLGHAATFWRASQRAVGGRLLLRIEDLDQQRSRLHFTEAIFEDLAWVGIEWKSPAVFQSQRLDFYHAVVDRLLQDGHIYPCRCSRKDLAAMLHAPHEEGRMMQPLDDEAVYPGTCRPAMAARPIGSLETGVNYRFRVPDGDVLRFDDRDLGAQSFAAGADFGDFLVWRKDGLPSYQLACVVDDAAMGITEVVRGRDLLLSTARQMLLQQALGFATPDYLHTPLLIDENGVRLAKRHDALSLRSLREGGATPAEVIARFMTTPGPQ